MRIRKLSLIRTLPEKEQLRAFVIFLETVDLLTLVNLFKGDQFAANYFSEEFRAEVKKFIKRRYSKDYDKLKGFLQTAPNHMKLHKKLKFLVNN
jgi:hypothetical protein